MYFDSMITLAFAVYEIKYKKPKPKKTKHKPNPKKTPQKQTNRNNKTYQNDKRYVKPQIQGRVNGNR